MSLGGGQIDEPALTKQVELPTILHQILIYHRSDSLLGVGHLLKHLDLDFDVEVAAIGDDHAVLHHFNVRAGNCFHATGKCDEDIAYRGGFEHGHDPVTIHGGLEGTHGVDLSHDDIGAHALGPHRNALSAPAVPGDDHSLAGPENVGRTGDTVERALARTVAVVEEVFRVCVVDSDDRVSQLAFRREAVETDHSGCRLLCPAYDAIEHIRPGRMERGYQIGAIVHRDVGLVVQGGVEVFVVGLVVLTVNGICCDTVLGYQGRSHGVLGAQGVAGAEHHLSPTVAHRDYKVSCLRRDV